MIDLDTKRGKQVGLEVAKTLRAAAYALERLDRSDEDICHCGDQRYEHLGRAIGCMGGYSYCDCRRFTLDRLALYGVATATGLIKALNQRADELDPLSAPKPEREKSSE